MIFDSSNGNLRENGSRKKVGRAVTEGEVIAMQVDTANWQIKWYVGQQQLAVTAIPEQMRGKTLYFVVIMAYQNDFVEMLID